MKGFKALLKTLIAGGLLVPAAVLAHPGHDHTGGLLERIHHAVIGWDQLAILLVIGVAAALYYFGRTK